MAQLTIRGSGLLAAILFSHLAMAQAETAAPTSVDYRIGVEDVLRISVWGEQALSLQVKVRPDGKINFPLVNEVAVEGLTPEELRLRLGERLSKFVREPNVTVIVDEINSFRVYVLGQVATQGALNFRRPTRLLQVIATAGGLTDFSKKEIIVIRDEAGAETRIRVDYKRLISGEGAQGNVFLKPGDTVIVN